MSRKAIFYLAILYIIYKGNVLQKYDCDGDETMSKTLDYYNENAETFCENTVSADMSSQYNMFEKYLFDGARILDCGCGSGRDAKYFIEQGYDVEAIDGSEELCRRASELTKVTVKNLFFQDIEYKSEFDGVWACASLLHVPTSEIKDVFIKIAEALRDNGILYASFKYGDFEGERNGRLFTDMNEASIGLLINDIPELEIKETYISGDVREGRGDEQWLNIILIKHDKKEIKTKDELAKTKEVEVLSSEIVFDETGHRILTEDKVKFVGALDCLEQCFSMGDIAANIQKGVEYVVQIPVKYQEMFNKGEVYINKNERTSVEWPTLMRKAENGRPQFVDNLPVKQQSLVQGNPVQDMCINFHNIAMQQQIAQLAAQLQETCEVVRLIEQGQQDDRIAVLEAGRDEIAYALTLKDEASRRAHIESGRSKLIEGTSLLGKALERRVTNFEAIPKNPVLRFGKAVLKSGLDSDYLVQKDQEFNNIEECYELYKRATTMLAMSWAITGENETVKATFDKSISFLKGLDCEAVKTVEYVHKDAKDLFYQVGVKELERDQKLCIEKAESYDTLMIELSGDKLLEVIEHGKVE